MDSCDVCTAPQVAVFDPSLAVITIAALVDSINPCAIAVLLILLGSLMATTDKRKVAITGLFFAAGLFVAYFLAGLGLFHALNLISLAKWLHLIVGIMAIIIGLLNIKDFFWYGAGGFITEIPRRWRPTMKNILSKIHSPIPAFLIGFVIIFFELPCTGGPYLFTLGYLAGIPKVSLIPTLLYYNLIFILPLLIITALIYFGYSNIEKANEWKERNIKILHLVAGIIMLGLGIWVILS
jgi:cytochrome c biogenesis protein CcdA